MNFHAALTLAVALSAAAGATAHPHASGSEHGASADAPASDQSQPGRAHAMEGQVRGVDRDLASITIYHDAMPSIGMPAMTMVFRVNDAALLERAGVGDQVRFRADRSGGTPVLVELDVLR